MPIEIKVSTIANDLYTNDLESPSDVSVGSISFWLRGAVGALNNLIEKSYSINEAGNEITPNLGLNEVAILKTMYLIYYYDRLIRANLGAAAYDSLLDVSSDGATVRKVNKNSISQTYRQLKLDMIDYLYKLVNKYRQTNGCTPLGIFGDDIYSPVPYRHEQGTSRKGESSQ